MALTTVTVTCPSCGKSKEFPPDTFPPQPVKVTCPACRQPFRFTGHLEISASGEEEPRVMEARRPAPASPQPKANQTSFVTALAWVFICLAGFATLISVLQNVMISTMFPLNKVQEAMSQAQAKEHMPPFFLFMFSHVRLCFAAFLVVSATTLVAAVALLKRKNWARIVFICLMGGGIIWNVAGVVLQQFMLSSLPQFPAGAPAEFGERFQLMFTFMRIFTFVMAAGMSVLFGWIIKRLVSPAVRKEFAKEAICA